MTSMAASISSSLMTRGGTSRMFPSAAFIGLAVIFLLVDILFIPADRWVNEPLQ